MRSLSLLVPSLLSTVVAAGPAASTLDKRATTWCDGYGKLETGTYTVYHNNWGAHSATSGYQCTTFDANNGGWVVWSTDWTWEGGPYSVKSYSNVAIDNVNKKLSEISSMPSTWNWRYARDRHLPIQGEAVLTSW
jgi:xyloglucan-specific endo-beta-1,4-glucanase